MPVKIHSGTSNVAYRVSATASQVALEIEGDAPRLVVIETPLLLDDAFEGKNFDIYYLTSPAARENDVRQLFCRETSTRIGWLIPALSLVSELHDFADNPHFLKYAYIAMRDALTAASESFFVSHVDIEDRESLSVTDVFSESTVFLVVSREKLAGRCKFDLQRALPSLVRNGYVPLGADDPSRIQFEAVVVDDGKVSYELVSSEIADPSIVSWLLESFASSHRDPVLQFFYLYQIIELLMELVLSFEHQSIAAELLAAGPDSAKIKIALEKVSESVAEKRRMQLLAEKYCEAEGDLHDLKLAGNELLRQLGMEAGTTLSTVLYPIRNFVFHRYRSFPVASVSALRNVVAELLAAMPVMLSRFANKGCAATTASVP